MTDDNSARKMTPKGARLPGHSLGAALPIAEALSELAAPSSKDRIASHNDETSSSGNFKRKFAAGRYYGLVEKEGDKYTLTERGERVLEGDVQAKRAAVMGTGFGPVIKSFSSRAVKVSAIEARLQDDYDAPEDSAKKLCEVLVASAREAGLIKDDKFDPAAIESVPDGGVGHASSGSGNSSSRSTGKKRLPAVSSPKAPVPEKPRQDSALKIANVPQVVIQIDGSKMKPTEIAELIRLLREPQ